MSKKKIYKSACTAYCIGYFLIFLVFYLPNYALELPEEFIGTYLVAREILERIVRFMIPATAAVIVFAAERDGGKGRKVWLSLLLASCAAIYYLPYCYLYALSLGFDSVESVGLSRMMTLGDIALRFAEIFLLNWLATLVSYRVARRSDADGSLLDRDKIRTAINENMIGAAFDLLHPATAGVLAIAIAKLAMALITEIYDTVTYLIEDAGMYGAGEIIYIMATYVILLGLMVLCHVICAKIKNLICKTEEE